jgi:hypothetical protein
MDSKKTENHYVLCIRNNGYDVSLEVRKVYRAIADRRMEQRGLLRVIDESGADYLYPRDFFVAITLPQEARSASLS